MLSFVIQFNCYMSFSNRDFRLSEVYLARWLEPRFNHRDARMPMNIDTGLVVVIAAVLIFYLRLIIIQRQRAKRMSRVPKPSGKKKGAGFSPEPQVRYSILSQNKRDWVIAGAGAIAILLGILLNAGLIPVPAMQPYWWVPTAIGIVAFSWGFKL